MIFLIDTTRNYYYKRDVAGMASYLKPEGVKDGKHFTSHKTLRAGRIEW